jgi:spore maturation protein SpmB
MITKIVKFFMNGKGLPPDFIAEVLPPILSGENLGITTDYETTYIPSTVIVATQAEIDAHKALCTAKLPLPL